ncbi:EmrB/QacA subfamily drug resistance transporter [Streptomyces sp. KhCrAH-43]|uniref:DHA2 family efflux MFS transporter permease subunit n=1 Tax=Streptomyces TaxID=1883 RepID=UPI000685F152|nr:MULTISPECIES: DHA2 family efflux MFS transporter permease subunit [unclassified Streptomyces]MYS39595.1 DHA2 family efflux MFS transporter permease subunit [Streptomyces sp. SID4920]MYX64341.1 DHA2 family efflux MFS transporter permease subunit [Streptomyces sp. SID8373]RAJ48787.1 EmrB/QacA subfamily drug resistance transporter [Streptomyces sp. KhCrAH-43]
MSTANPPTPATGKQGVVFWAILTTSVASFMAGLDNLVIITALPTISEKLGGSLSDLEWTVNAYTLSFAVLMMFGAALGDRFGRRKVFSLGLLLFTGASAAAALAPGVNELIAARAVQGAGAAIIMPLSVTLLTAAVPAEKRGAALGIWGAVNGLSIAAGPLVGGAIVEHISWQWIFWLNVPIGLALAPLSWAKLKESRIANSRLDAIGTILASAGLFGIVLGLIKGHEKGWTSAFTLSALIGGAVVMAGFVVWENHTEHPMVPMRLFRIRAFTAINLAGTLMSVGMFGAIFLMTQFLQNIQGYTAMEAGVRLLAWTAMPMVVAPVAGMVSDRIGGKPVVTLGLALMTAGMVWWAFVLDPGVSYVAQLPSLMICGAGMAMFYAPLMNLTMGSVAEHEQGIASGVTAATREVGAALGVALLASIFSANGGYASPQNFVDGLVPAMWVGAVAVALATFSMLIAPGRRAAQTAVAAKAAPVAAAPAPVTTPEPEPAAQSR